MKTESIEKELKEVYDVSASLFISDFHIRFNKHLHELDNTTKHIIRNNKQLNQMYDLFIDFIIDSSKHFPKI